MILVNEQGGQIQMRVTTKLSNLLLALVVFAGSVFGLAGHVLASTYGGGNYGDCQYQNGCSTSSSSSSGSGSTGSTSSTGTGSSILLNDFDEYFQEAGKQLDLSAKQVVYFNVEENNTTVKHSVTVQTVGADYVIVVIASDPITARLNIGETKQFDVTGDSVDDILITLNSVKSGKANLTFEALSAPTPAPSPAPAPQVETKGRNWTMLLIYGGLMLLGLILIIILFVKRRKKDEQRF